MITAYYLISLHVAQQLYNWIALLVLECLAVVFWLSTWAVLAAAYAIVAAYDCYYSTYCDLDSAGGIVGAYYAIWKVVIVLGVVQL